MLGNTNDTKVLFQIICQLPKKITKHMSSMHVHYQSLYYCIQHITAKQLPHQQVELRAIRAQNKSRAQAWVLARYKGMGTEAHAHVHANGQGQVMWHMN
jgi:hypothetical protein